MNDRDAQSGDEDALSADLPDDSAVNPAAQRKREQRIKREAREAAEFWRRVFDDPVGRRELYRLLHSAQRGSPFETHFPQTNAGFPDPNAAWHRLGEHDFARRLFFRWLRDYPFGVHQMLQENQPGFLVKPTPSASRDE